MAKGIRTGDPSGFNKGHSSKFSEGSRVRQTPEKARRTYRPKSCGNKDEDNSQKTLMIKINKLRLRNLVTFMFHIFFNSQAKSRYLYFFSVSFDLTPWFSRDSKVHNSANSLFLLIIIRYGRLAEIRWSVRMSKSKRSLYVSFSRTNTGLSVYHFFVLSNVLSNSPWITLLTKSCYCYYLLL